MQPGWGTALVFPRLICKLIMTGPVGNWGRGALVQRAIKKNSIYQHPKMQMSSRIVYIKGTRLSLVERSPSRILSCFASKSVSFFTVFSWVEVQSHVILPIFLPEIFHFESCVFACFVFPPLSSIVIVRMDSTALSTRRVRSGLG